jgi:hypothetical protein
MLSMPPAIPTSICPTAIEFAILVIALRPDAQARFTVLKDVVVGMPTWLAACKGGCTKLVYVSHAIRTAKTCHATGFRAAEFGEYGADAYIVYFRRI